MITVEGKPVRPKLRIMGGWYTWEIMGHNVGRICHVRSRPLSEVMAFLNTSWFLLHRAGKIPAPDGWGTAT